MSLYSGTTKSLIVDVQITACGDSKYDKFHELAVSGHATPVLTGNSDLLGLNPLQVRQLFLPGIVGIEITEQFFD